MPNEINLALLRLTRRAEASDPKVLVSTFVDTGMLQTMLASIDHQIIYGRRGTGKTHALLYLFETKRQVGDASIFVDMRTIGSSGGLFSDDTVPLAERATRLLRDTLTHIHERLFDIATAPGHTVLDLSRVAVPMEAFLDAAIETQVLGGTTTIEEQTSAAGSTEKSSNVGLNVGPSGVSGAFGASGKDTLSQAVQTKAARTGQSRHRVRFGAIGQTLGQIAQSIAPRRIWVLLDEWSAVPIELQPYLADMIRRCILPITGVTVKIAAIEQRSHFLIPGEHRGDYTGIEIGADVPADLNLDDFMVFDNSATRSVEFFRKLIFNHFVSIQAEVTP
jgi:hypothetical protein